MTEQVVARTSSTMPNTRVIGLAALFALLMIAAHAGAPYLFNRATLQSEIATQVKTTTGLTISSQHARFALLPSPHVAMRTIRIADPSGALLIGADELDGGVRLLPLIVGRIELADVALVKPVFTIDLDRGVLGSVSPLRQAFGSALDQRRLATGRLGSISLVDGRIDVSDRRLGGKQTLTNVNIAVDWRDLQSPASLTGSLRASNIESDVALWVAQPLKLMRGDRSALALSIRSIPLELSATGSFSGAPFYQFAGRISGAAADTTALLSATSLKLPLPSRLAGLALSAEAIIGFSRSQLTRIDLQDVKAQADGNSFEGTGAFQNGAVPSLTATLATDRLSLAPFLNQMPHVLKTSGSWSDESFDPKNTRPLDLDMRVSANHLRIGRFEIEDAAMSVLTRDDRVEVGVDEGTAYGGSLKGHASIGLKNGDMDVRMAGTATNVDLATLSWDAFGRQVASGQLSASASLTSSGANPLQLVEHLQGWTKLTAEDGGFSASDASELLHEPAAPAQQAASGTEGETPFTHSLLEFAVDHGVAALVKGRLSSPSTVTDLTGQANLAMLRLDVTATLRRSGPSVPTRFAVEGDFEHLKMIREPVPSTETPTAP